MLELANHFGSLWIEYFSLVLLQNTLFLCLIFLSFSVLKNASARIKYIIAMIGLFKLLLPAFLPVPINEIFSTNSSQTGVIFIENIATVLVPAGSYSSHLSINGLLFILWMMATFTYLFIVMGSTLLLRKKVKKSASMLSEMRTYSEIQLFQSNQTSTPLSIGIFPKKIFLPKTWKSLPADCQKVMLQHELAHIRRRDGFFQLFQIIAQALYFFHPLVWMLNERINEYREMACDDEAVVDTQLSPLAYSRYLVYLAEKMVPSQWSYTSATALIRRKNKLLNRVNYQMKEVTMRQLSKKRLIITVVGLLLLIVPFSWYSSHERPIEAAEISTTLSPKNEALTSKETGKITGSVKDKATGKPLSSANVIVEGTKLGAATNKDGNFWIVNVPSGIYNLKVTMMGYKSVLISSLKVRIHKTTTVNFLLEPVVILFGKEEFKKGEKIAPPLSEKVIVKEPGESKAESLVPPPPPHVKVSVPPKSKGELLAPPPPPKLPDSDVFFIAYDKPPEPIGGVAAILKNLKYSEIANKAGYEGAIFVAALIDEAGQVIDAKIQRRSLRKGTGETEISVIKSKSSSELEISNGPGDESLEQAVMDAIRAVKWEPARQRDKPVKVWVSVPIQFKLKK